VGQNLPFVEYNRALTGTFFQFATMTERSFPSLNRSLPPLDNLCCLRNNVIMGYDVPAILAAGTCEIRNGFCFGSGNLNPMVALRARTKGCFTHGFMASTLKIDGLPIHENLASATGSKPSAFQAESFQHLCWIMLRWLTGDN